MSAIFCDGFAHYATTQGQVKWNAFQGATILNDPTFGNCVQLAPGGIINKTLSQYPSAVTGFVVGFRCRTNFSGQSAVFKLYGMQAVLANTGIADVITLQAMPDNTLALFAGDNTLITNPKTFSIADGVSFYVEIKGTVSGGSSSGNVVTVGGTLRVNGDTLGSGTANITLDLLATSAAVDVIYLSSIANDGFTYVKDFYLLDQSGPTNNNFLGDVSISAIYPRQDVNVAIWQSSNGSPTHFNLVNEHVPDGDATYVYTSAPPTSQLESYFFDLISSFVGTISFVQLLLYMRKDQEGIKAVQHAWANGAVLNPIIAYIADEYRYYHVALDGPNGAGDATAWTVASVNSTDFGVSLNE